MGAAIRAKIARTIRAVILIAKNEKRVGIFNGIVQALRFRICRKCHKRRIGDIGQTGLLHCAVSKGNFDFVKHYFDSLVLI